MAFGGTLILVIAANLMFGDGGPWLLGAIVYVLGFLLGAFLGKAFGAGVGRAVGAGAFLGVGLLWSPVVLVTYGFALLALPLLAIYGYLANFGVRVGAQSAQIRH